MSGTCKLLLSLACHNKKVCYYLQIEDLLRHFFPLFVDGAVTSCDVITSRELILRSTVDRHSQCNLLLRVCRHLSLEGTFQKARVKVLLSKSNPYFTLSYYTPPFPLIIYTASVQVDNLVAIIKALQQQPQEN